MVGFKDIKGYKGIYKINELGTIVAYPKTFMNNGNLLFKKGYTVSVSEDSSGYLKATLRDAGGNKSAPKVHRLVAETFLGDRPDGMEINHKDGNKLNNNVSNLEYISHKDNVIHAFDTGLNNNYAGNHVFSKLTKDNVIEMRNDKHNTNAHYAKKFNVNSGTISRARRGESWKRI